MFKKSAATKILCARPETWPDATSAIALIEARVADVVRPNLDSITFPKLGDLPCVYGEYQWRLPKDQALQKHYQDPSISVQGIFHVYDNPSGNIGALVTRRIWGFSREAQWLAADVYIWKHSSKSNGGGGWIETVQEVRIEEMPLAQLLATMKRSENGIDSQGAWHGIDNEPLAIWHYLGNFILQWHRNRQRAYLRSKRFSDIVRQENFLLQYE